MPEREPPSVVSLRLETTGDPVGIALVFTRSRTRILSVDWGEGSLAGSSIPEDFAAELEWGDRSPLHPVAGVEGGRWLEVKVSFRGELPSLAEAAWLFDDPDDLPRDGGHEYLEPEWLPQAQSLIASELGADFNQLIRILQLGASRITVPLVPLLRRDASAYLQSRRQGNDAVVVKRQEAIRRRAAADQFFFELDRETQEGAAIFEATRIVDTMLSHRINRRAALARETPPQSPCFTKEDGNLLEALKSVSELFVRLATSHLEEGGVSFFGWAMELFATDRLGVQYPDVADQRQFKAHGTAQGVLFFMFTDLAFAAIENDVPDANWWQSELAELVRVARVFVEHCGGPQAGATIENKESYKFEEPREVHLSAIQASRKDFQNAVYATTRADHVSLMEDAYGLILMEALPATGDYTYFRKRNWINEALTRSMSISTADSGLL